METITKRELLKANKIIKLYKKQIKEQNLANTIFKNKFKNIKPIFILGVDAKISTNLLNKLNLYFLKYNTPGNYGKFTIKDISKISFSKFSNMNGVGNKIILELNSLCFFTKTKMKR